MTDAPAEPAEPLELLDFDTLIFKLLTRVQRPEETIKPNITTTDSEMNVPLITYRVVPNAAINDGGDTPPVAWYAELDLTFSGIGREATFAMASRYYSAIHRWNDPWEAPPAGLVDGLGHATSVTDRSAPSRSGEVALKGRLLVEMAAGFSLQLHKA